MALSHDYRWLGSSIKQALKDDPVSVTAGGSGKAGSEARSWKQIQSENSTKGQLTMAKIAAEGAAKKKDADADAMDANNPNAAPAVSAAGAPDSNALIVDERD